MIKNKEANLQKYIIFLLKILIDSFLSVIFGGVNSNYKYTKANADKLIAVCNRELEKYEGLPFTWCHENGW